MIIPKRISLVSFSIFDDIGDAFKDLGKEVEGLGKSVFSDAIKPIADITVDIGNGIGSLFHSSPSPITSEQDFEDTYGIPQPAIPEDLLDNLVTFFSAEANLEKSMISIATEVNTNLDSLSTIADQVIDTINSINQKIDNYSTTGKATTTVGDLKNDITAEFNTLSDKSREFGKCTELDNKLSTYKSDLTQLEAQVYADKSRSSELSQQWKRDMERIDRIIADPEKELDHDAAKELSANYKKLKEDLDKMVADFSKLDSQLLSMEQVANNLNTTWKSVTSNLDAIRDSVSKISNDKTLLAFSAQLKSVKSSWESIKKEAKDQKISI